MKSLIQRLLEAVFILALVWMLAGCAVVEQSARFVGEGFKLVGTAANETGKAFGYAADSVNEPDQK